VRVLSKKLALMKNQDGATIIEYALVAPILFLMVFAIIEFALVQQVQAHAMVLRAVRMM
jgi:Flp pilus assembly protein TadG